MKAFPFDQRQKLRLEYPCEWQYKLIGRDEGILRDIIREVIQERTCSVTVSNWSRTGKYVCVNLELIVLNEGDRTDIFEALREHPAVKMVL